MLDTKNPNANKDPLTNADKFTSPEKPGIKKPTTAEAISIFAISAKNFEIASS